MTLLLFFADPSLASRCVTYPNAPPTLVVRSTKWQHPTMHRTADVVVQGECMAFYEEIHNGCIEKNDTLLAEIDKAEKE